MMSISQPGDEVVTISYANAAQQLVTIGDAFAILDFWIGDDNAWRPAIDDPYPTLVEETDRSRLFRLWPTDDRHLLSTALSGRWPRPSRSHTHRG